MKEQIEWQHIAIYARAQADQAQSILQLFGKALEENPELKRWLSGTYKIQTEQARIAEQEAAFSKK